MTEDLLFFERLFFFTSDLLLPEEPCVLTFVFFLDPPRRFFTAFFPVLFVFPRTTLESVFFVVLRPVTREVVFDFVREVLLSETFEPLEPEVLRPLCPPFRTVTLPFPEVELSPDSILPEPREVLLTPPNLPLVEVLVTRVLPDEDDPTEFTGVV